MNQPTADLGAIAAIIENLDTAKDPETIRQDLRALAVQVQALAAQSQAAPVPAPNPDLLTLAQAAAYISAEPRWVRLAYQQGRIPTVRLGRNVRFRRADLDDWIAAGGTPWAGSSRRYAAR